MKKKIISALLISAMIVSAASCASGGSGSAPAATAAAEGAKDIGAPAPEAAEGTMPAATAVTTAMPYDDSYDAADYEWSEDYFIEDSRSEEKEHSQARAGLLTGGEWRDNTNFAYWRSLFAQREEWQNISAEWQLDTLERIVVRVTGAGKPAAGLTVKLASGSTLLWEAVTDSRGEAFLFTGINTDRRYAPDKIIVETANGKAVTTDVPEDFKETDTAVEIAIPDESPMRTELDLMFVIDTTGSMGDELKYLQTELASVIDRAASNTGVDTRLSVNFYRDDGDDYVVRDFGFTKNISIAIEHLEDQRASGGGDYPEAVTKALKNAIVSHDWASGSEKLMFLVLDAPPHRADALSELESIIRNAAQTGIRIIPVASSGVDTDTEFLCRTMAIATGGTYTFLTDDSGIGNSHLEPTIGNYTVEKLNDMLVRIISDYFSQEPRSYNTQAPAPQQQTQEPDDYGYPAEYFYTHDYFEGEGMYTVGLIRSAEELEDFHEKYNFKVTDDFYDFDRCSLAYKVDLLSSGSITVDDSEGVYCVIENGKPVFRYKLDVPEVGTADIKTLFLFAEIPNDELGQY